MPNRRALAVSALLAAALTACSAAAPSALSTARPGTTTASLAGAPPVRTTAVPAPRTSFTLVATGDVLIHQDLQLTSGARRPDGSYDFTPVMAPVAPIIRGADVAICHFETPGGPTADTPASRCSRRSSPP